MPPYANGTWLTPCQNRTPGARNFAKVAKVQIPQGARYHGLLHDGAFMFRRFTAASAALLLTITFAEARRVALVIGQDDYSSIGALDNSVRDARKVTELLTKHGFEVIACDGSSPGCLNANGARLQANR